MPPYIVGQPCFIKSFQTGLSLELDSSTSTSCPAHLLLSEMPSSSCESSEVGSIVSYSSLDDAEDEGGQKRVYVPQEKKSFKRCCCYSLFSVVVLDFTLVILFGIKSFSSDPLKQTKAKSPCSQFPADCAHTAPFVFDSLYSLLKQWPSTYAPNGHSIAAGVIPADTPLYHAQGYPGPPRKPTFYAFDA